MWKSVTISVVILIIGFSLFLFLPKCTSKFQYQPTPPVNNEKIINEELFQMNKINAEKDSVINSRTIEMRKDSVNLVKQVNKYKTAYLNAIKTAPDTCKTYINTIYSNCNNVDSIRNIYALKQDSIIKDQEQQKQNYKLQLVKKDLIIGIKNDSLNTMLYNNEQLQRKIVYGWFKTGGALLAGFFVGKSLK